VDVQTPDYVQIDVEFYFVARGMKNSKDKFYVEYYDGSSWNTVATFACKVDFQVNNFYKAVVSIPESAYNFPTDMKIRFRSGAKKDNKDVYIDDIRIFGSTVTVQSNVGVTLMTKAAPVEAIAFEDETTEISLYPNPARNNLNIVSSLDMEMTVFIYNLRGQQVYYGERLDNHQVIDVSNFDNGLYIVKVISDDEVITTRFLKQ
jgi:bacillolysin